MKKIRSISVLFIICFFCGSNANAFLPDTANLVNFMLKKKGTCSSYFSAADSNVFSFEGENVFEAKIDLYYSCSGYFRANLKNSLSAMVYMESTTKAMTLHGEEIVSEKPSKYFLFKDIFWLYEYQAFIDHLQKRGCEVSRIRFDKKDGRICYVIGKINSESLQDQAELWIDKETFLPYFYDLVFEGSRSSFKFKNYFKEGGLFYPGITEIFINDVLARKIDVKFLDSSFKPDSNNFFIIDKFLNLYKKSDSGFEDELPVMSDSIEKIFE